MTGTKWCRMKRMESFLVTKNVAINREKAGKRRSREHLAMQVVFCDWVPD
jgi:hypothetical protein